VGNAALEPTVVLGVVGEEYEDQVAQLVTFGEQSLDQQVLLPGSIARHGYVQDFASLADLFVKESVKMLSPGKARENERIANVADPLPVSSRLRNPVAPQR
jgi:hypothetical protein